MLNFTVIAAVSILTAVLATALLRERRLRLALEALVIKLVKRWRNRHADRQPGTAEADRAECDRDRRLQ